MADLSEADLPYRLSDVLLLDGLPHYPYYALKEGATHVVHPMALGRFLLRNATGNMASYVMEAALEVAFELPNGGLAWYYPRHYRVNRMLGGKLKYSSISQGTIMAGLTELATHNANIGFEYAQRAFEAMRWPYEQGGVSLADRALLEMPSAAGPPEIILNGWIDALLHIRDYAELSGDIEAERLFRANVEFLAEVVSAFDSREARISRYSDVSPYRAAITLSSHDDADTLSVLYRPRVQGFPTILVPLEDSTLPESVSPYDNQIIGRSSKGVTAWLSCSQLYDTVLMARSGQMTVKIDAGRISRTQATPGSSGRIVQLSSTEDRGWRVVELDSDSDLICGYPTNFLKNGEENYYHVYHIVGLLLLAMAPEVDEHTRKPLVQWAMRWLTDMEHLQETEKLIFHDLQNMLDDINRNRALTPYRSWVRLLTDATLELAVPGHSSLTPTDSTTALAAAR